jgi:high-affinity iron transporter
MLATLVIFLREGVEASMIVAILLAYLNRSGQRQHFKDVYLGVAAALVLAGGGGLLAYFTIRTYAGSRAQTIFETATFLLATAILTYMTFWMRSHARGLKSELAAKADAVLAARGRKAAHPRPAEAVPVLAGAAGGRGVAEAPRAGAAPASSEDMGRGARWGLGLLAFQAVGREGLETVVFTLAIAFSVRHQGGLLTGALIGLAIALAIAFVMYRLGHRINIGRFFMIVGSLLMVFAAGLLVDAVENLQQLGWLPGGSHVLWHTGAILSEDSALGDIAHSFFGYAQSPTLLQAIVYLAYLACVLSAFFGVRQRLQRRSASAAR